MDNPTVNQNDKLIKGFLPKRAALYIGILAFALVLLLFLGAGHASAEDVSGDIAVDTPWLSDHVYNVTGNVNVLADATLTVQNNVTVVFQGNYAINVYGEMVVAGTATDWVDFTYNNSIGSEWTGIYFHNGSAGSIAYANIDTVSEALNFDNVSIPCSNVNIDNAGSAFYYNYYGPTHDVAITLSDITINHTFFGVTIENKNGSLDLTMNNVSTNNSFGIASFEATNAVGTGTIDLAIVDSMFNDTIFGIYADADMFGDVVVRDSTFAAIFVNALELSADSGDMAITLDGVTFDEVYNGLSAYVEFGNVDMTITDSMLSGDNVLVDITVNSNMLTNGFVNIAVTNSEFSEATYGIRAYAEEMSPIMVTDSSFINITGYAMHFDVRSNDLSVTLTNDTIMNSWTGLYVVNNNGSLDLSLVGVHFDTMNYGVNATVSSVNDTNMSSINMEVTNSVIEGGMYGIYGTSINDGSIMISGSEFLGQSEISYYFDSLYGNVDVEITDSVFDGSSSGSAGTVYTVEQIDYQFDIYGRTHAWDGIYYSGGDWVDLPFAFEYNGEERTEVWVDQDGYLDFLSSDSGNSGSSIRPIGNVDLDYSGDHFFGYVIAADESYVVFNWYAGNDDTEYEQSNSFQVILYANGEIQFNFAAMDGDDGSNAWGLLNSNFPNLDYNLYQLMDYTVWDADYSSFLFTPHDISRGTGITVRSEAGDVDFVLNNNTITSYYQGGVYAQATNGDMVFTATDNAVSYMYAPGSGPRGIISASAYNGTINAIIVNNTFLRLWSPAVFAYAMDTVGGEHSFEVTGNEFIKTYYGVYTYVDINEMWTDSDNDTLSVVANFQNNTMTDSFGLANSVYLRNTDAINWTISVEQTFTGNVMTQAWYEGSYPLPSNMGYLGSIIESGLELRDVQTNNVTTMNVEHLVTIADNEIETAADLNIGIWVYSDIYKGMGDVDNVCSLTITDNLVSVWDRYGIDVYVTNEAVCGTVDSDNSVVIQNNQITGGYGAIYVFIEGESDWDEEMALDMNAITYLSITGNVIEGAYEGISVDIEYDQDDTVGVWMVNVTAHIDSNQLNNVTYGVYAELTGDVEFNANYWPYYDEVAIGNFVMNYLLTIDNNVIISVYGYSSDPEDAIICVDVSYWADVDPTTHFTEAYATVNGVISVSGNEVTQQMFGELTMLFLSHSYEAEKTGVMNVNVDIAVENNVFVTEEMILDGLDPSMGNFGMLLEDNANLSGSMPTDEPTVMADVSWSVTGNEITGPLMTGIAMVQQIYIDSESCDLVDNFSADISGNTIDGVGEAGIGFVLSRNFYPLNGYVVLNIDLSIEGNTVAMGRSYRTIVRESSGVMIAFNERPISDAENYNSSVVINATVSDNTMSGAAIGVSLGSELEMDGEGLAFLDPYAYMVNFVVENNYINNSEYGIIAYGGNMTLSNNVIEDCEYGIDWSYANGEVVGNTITANYGIGINEPYQVLVQGNDVTFGVEGVYLFDWYPLAEVQILDNTLSCSGTMSENDSYGIELEETGNVLISGNIITDSYYGIYVDVCYNLTVSDNQILRSIETGIEMYDVYQGWIESNIVSYGENDGVYVGDGCSNIVIGNNTIANNLDDGLVIDEDDEYGSIYSITLFNNEIVDNGDYGVYTDTWYAELIWYVDAGCTVARNDVDFYGNIMVMAGGAMMVEDVHEFEVDEYIHVNEGGLFSASNTNFYGYGDIEVYGDFWANVCLFDGFNIYLGPTSEAEIRGGAIMGYDYAGVYVDGCAPVIADNLIFSFDGKYGILVEGEGAAPSIVSNIIALNDFGIYARGTDMGGVYDNIIILNDQAGILAEDATGRIHDNILLVNKIDILLRNSNVSVEDNEIGYTNLFQVLANYAPLLAHFANLSSVGILGENVTSDDPLVSLGNLFGIADFDLYDLATWVKGHNGIWAEDSVVWTSGNTYGMVNYALYAVRSEIHFADDIRTVELTVPHSSEGVTYTYSLNIYVLNGIFASDSQLWVDGSTIEVLDDGLMLDNTQAWVEGATLMAGDFDYFLYNGAEVFNIASTYGKFKVEDSHSLNEGTWLTLYAVDDGEPAANVSVIIKNAKGDIVFQGVTDAEGKIKVLLTQYSITSQGKDDGFNPYSINATFASGVKTMELTLNESYMDATITGEKETDMGAILAVVGVLVIILLIVAAVVVMRRRK